MIWANLTPEEKVRAAVTEPALQLAKEDVGALAGWTSSGEYRRAIAIAQEGGRDEQGKRRRIQLAFQDYARISRRAAHEPPDESHRS